ncbi:hypothetical protein L226DRAFT_130724 [Lentinus tigrinus ALCF2SS1-7]|uniref:Uncharacterized protein n=1 Tax=Lentinus tigrinus ALCF2SS1-6 TaxID=1328759 RepID=A0A5C2T5I7_9APHY|nr:hypothetical protein L227DRAFT_17483 [Lentinus tigrinus ALCF2SS1-6]RPD81146.1 hypothetical protein L226DRAFT_130724 [Lentinus tigrinus ALCF2SS1-7]
MAPRSGRRNMGWRKPPPRLSPECSTASSYPSRGLRRLSLTININKDMPPLPTDWRETMEHALKKERRCAVYVAPPPVPPKDDASDVASRRESLAITLVEELFDQVEDTLPVPPPHSDIQEQIECVERAENRLQATPVITKRASQKSLPKIYRPPTPPLPAQHPRLRSVGGHHSRSSSESQTHTLDQGVMLSEQRDTTPCPSVLTSWPSRLAPDVSVTLHSQASRSHILSLSENDPYKRRGHGSPRATGSRRSGVSTSTGNRSSAGQSQFTCHMCRGVWCALKSLGLRLRAKMTHSSKY